MCEAKGSRVCQDVDFDAVFMRICTLFFLSLVKHYIKYLIQRLLNLQSKDDNTRKQVMEGLEVGGGRVNTSTSKNY